MPDTPQRPIPQPSIRFSSPGRRRTQTPPFDEIRPEHFLPAFERAFADHAAEIAAITHDPALPDFANTITALERSGKLLAKVSAVFYDLVSAHSNPEILEIDKEVSLADGAALEPDHDERGAVWTHRAAARQSERI